MKIDYITFTTILCNARISLQNHDCTDNCKAIKTIDEIQNFINSKGWQFELKEISK